VLPDLLAAPKVNSHDLQVALWLAWVHQVADGGVQAAQHKVVGLHITVADGALVAVSQELQHTLGNCGSLKLCELTLLGLQDGRKTVGDETGASVFRNNNA
jgi:hypothetical protein